MRKPRESIGFVLLLVVNFFYLRQLRSQYIKNSPEGMSAHDIKLMSDNDLLDMDYFLHEFDDDDDFSEEGFYLF